MSFHDSQEHRDEDWRHAAKSEYVPSTRAAACWPVERIPLHGNRPPQPARNLRSRRAIAIFGLTNICVRLKVPSDWNFIALKRIQLNPECFYRDGESPASFECSFKIFWIALHGMGVPPAKFKRQTRCHRIVSNGRLR